MQTRVKTQVTLYVAPAMLAALIPKQENGTALQSLPIKVSQLMRVELTSPDGAFTVDQDPHPDKIVDDPEATRPAPWTFQVTPLKSGDHDLVANVYSLRTIAGASQPLVIDSETQKVHVKVNVIGEIRAFLFSAWPLLSPFAVVVVGAYPFFKRRRRRAPAQPQPPDHAAWIRRSPDDLNH